MPPYLISHGFPPTEKKKTNNFLRTPDNDDTRASLLQSTPLITQKHGNTSVTQCAHPHNAGNNAENDKSSVSQEVAIKKNKSGKRRRHTRGKLGTKAVYFMPLHAAELWEAYLKRKLQFNRVSGVCICTCNNARYEVASVSSQLGNAAVWNYYVL